MVIWSSLLCTSGTFDKISYGAKTPQLLYAVGELCLDIEIYLEALEAVHTAGFGEGVQVLFCILNGHCEAPKELVIT
jgi:hypothetical protein